VQSIAQVTCRGTLLDTQRILNHTTDLEDKLAIWNSLKRQRGIQNACSLTAGHFRAMAAQGEGDVSGVTDPAGLGGKYLMVPTPVNVKQGECLIIGDSGSLLYKSKKTRDLTTEARNAGFVKPFVKGIAGGGIKEFNLEIANFLQQRAVITGDVSGVTGETARCQKVGQGCLIVVWNGNDFKPNGQPKDASFTNDLTLFSELVRYFRGTS